MTLELLKMIQASRSHMKPSNDLTQTNYSLTQMHFTVRKHAIGKNAHFIYLPINSFRSTVKSPGPARGAVSKTQTILPDYNEILYS